MAIKQDLYLSQVYGDCLFERSDLSKVEGKKNISAINKNDIKQGDLIKEISDMIENSNFNKRLEEIFR